MAEIPDAKNLPNAAIAGAGAEMSAATAPIAGATILLTQFQQVLSTIMSNPALGGVALQSLGSGISNHIVKRLRETVSLSREQNRELETIISKYRGFTMLAGAVGGFAMKVSLANIEIKKLGIEMASFGRLSQMPGGAGGVYGIGKNFAQERMSGTWNVNANWADEQMKMMQQGWSNLAGRGVGEEGQKNIAKLAATYHLNNKGNLVAAIGQLTNTWSGQISPQQAIGFYRNFVERDENEGLGMGSGGENAQTMMNLMGTGKELGADFGKSHQMAFNFMAASQQVGLSNQHREGVASTMAGILGNQEKRTGMYGAMRGMGLWGGSEESFTRQFVDEDGNLSDMAMVRMFNAQQKISKSLIGGHKNKLTMNKTEQSNLEKMLPIMGISATDAFTYARMPSVDDLAKNQKVLGGEALKTGGLDAISGKLTEVDAKFLNTQKSLWGLGDALKYVSQGSTLLASEIVGESNVQGAVGIGGLAVDALGVGAAGWGGYKGLKYLKGLVKGGKIVIGPAGKLIGDLTTEQVLANLAKGKGGKLTGFLSKMGNTGKIIAAGLAALGLTVATSESAKAEGVGDPKNETSTAEDIYGSVKGEFESYAPAGFEHPKLEDSFGSTEEYYQFLKKSGKITGGRYASGKGGATGSWGEDSSTMGQGGAGTLNVVFTTSDGKDLGSTVVEKASQNVIRINLNSVLGVE